MLTSELVRVRRDGEYVVPRYISPRDRPRLLALGDALIGALAVRTGQRREEVLVALAAVDCAPRDRLVAAGLTKLLLDRCELVSPSGAVARARAIASSAKRSSRSRPSASASRPSR